MTATISHPPGIQEPGSPQGRQVLRICIWSDVFVLAVVGASAGWGCSSRT